MRVVAFLLALSVSWSVQANTIETGPLIDKLKVTQAYMVSSNSSPFLYFSAGSMPGCYGERGGYLVMSNTLSKELYSQVLMLMSIGGMKGNVLYKKTGSPQSAWSACHVVGLSLQPE